MPKPAPRTARLRALFLAAVLALLAACAPEAPPPDDDPPVDDAARAAAGAPPAPEDTWPVHERTSPEIRAEDLAYRISTLADDRFAGRFPGEERGELAADWIAGEMERMGLQPAGDDGTWFQEVPMIRSTLDEARSSLDIVVGDEPMGLRFRDDVVYWSPNPEAAVAVDDSELVFVGYGVTAPEYDWDDYAGTDVTGKTVVILINDPGFARPDAGRFNGEAMTYYGRWTYKYEEAARRGAAGAIIVHQAEPASYGWTVVHGWAGPQLLLDAGDDEPAIPVHAWAREEVVQRLFEAAGHDFDALAEAAAEPGFEAVELGGARLSASLHSDLEPMVSRNVAGRIEGSARPDEHLLYMAHWDHMGERVNDDGSVDVYNGAIDNASGTAFILELAEAIAADDPAPERSLLFVAVTAEEQGLLGSEYYARRPLVPLEKTVAGFNFDALQPVGRTRDVMVVGKGSSELEDLLEEKAAAQGRHLVPEANPAAGSFYRSDHVSLARRGLPVMYASGGLEHVERGREYGEAMLADYYANRYHEPGDEFDPDWDLTGLAEDAELFAALSRRLANSEDWPNWYEGNEFRALRDAMMD